MNKSLRIRRLLRQILATGLAIMLVLSLAVPAFAAKKEVETGKKVIMGYYSEAGLMNGAKNGAVKSGYAYEYIQELASHAGWKYDYVYGSFAELYQLLKEGKIDMLPYITRTEERAREVLFPDKQMGDEQFFIASMEPGKLSDDLHELQGAKVGTNKNAFHLQPFGEMMKEKGVTCELVTYDDPDKRWKALENGEVDYTIETSTVFQNVDLHAVFEFGDRYPYYLIVAPGREDLLAELNKAQVVIDEVNPGFLENLKLKYFKGIPLFKELPEESRQWLKEHDSIRIGSFNYDAPYVIENADGSVAGILPDYTALMMKAIGVDHRIEWKIYDGMKEAVRALKRGEIDCINPYYHNYSDAEEAGLIISGTVYESAFSVLYEGEYTSETLSKIATPDTRLGAYYVRDNYPDAKIVPCLNGYDCIEKLLAGESTCVVMHTDALTEIAKTFDESFNMKALNASCDVCFAALPKDAPLISAINKSIPFVTDVEMNAIQNRYNEEENTKEIITLTGLMKSHPWTTAIVLCLVFLAVFLIYRKNVMESRKTEEIRRLTDNLLKNYYTVFRVNLSDASFKTLKMDDGTIGKGIEFADFNESKNFFVTEVAYEPDRDMLRHELDINTIREKIKSKPTYPVEYRIVVDGIARWYEMIVSSLGDNEVALAFAEKDAELLNQHISRALLDSYEGIYVVNLNTDQLKILKATGITEKKPEIISNSRLLKELADKLTGEAGEYFSSMSDPEYAKSVLKKDGKSECVYLSPNYGGRPVWLKTEMHVLTWVNGEPETAVIGISLVDSVQKEKIEITENLKETLAIAQSANTAKTEFLFNISHDVRTPMNAILGFTEIAEKNLDDREKVADCLAKTKQSGDLLLSLINEVLEMSRIESGIAENDEKEMDVLLSFEKIKAMMEEEAARKNINLSFEFGDITDRYVYADTGRCTRIFTNLISNAIKYNNEGGNVSVRCDQVSLNDGGSAFYRYTVTDDGVGMDEEFRSHMYEAFTREHNSTQSGIIGAGLGLSLCKTFVDYLGGTIECTSEPGKGTEFVVILPFRIREAAEDPDNAAMEAEREREAETGVLTVDFTGRKALLVEDNELNSEIAQEILEDEGIEVDTAEDGAVAVDIMREKGPDYYDFILMDIQMPVMNGYEATKAIREMYPEKHIPIVAVSANAFAEDKAASIAAGMDDHVAKPINVAELLNAVAKQLK